MLDDAAQIDAWFASHRSELTGNGNWFLGGEPNTQPGSLSANAAVRVLVARLSSYHDVARGITHSFLYQMACSVTGCYVDMAFFPGDRDEKLFRESGVPLWTGTTSKLPPTGFDLIAISNSVLQELINLPAALEYSGIPLTAAEREKVKSPLVIVGGSNAYNLSVLHDVNGAGLVDGVVIGDGENTFARLIEIIRDCKDLPRSELVGRLRSSVEGFYDPSSYLQKFAPDGTLAKVYPVSDAPFPVKAAKVACIDSKIGFTGGPILYDEDSAGSSHLLMTAGCPSFCSFCKESWEQKPYRERQPEALLENALALKANMGLNELALMSFNATTYSHIFSLVEKLDRLFNRVSIKSQRFDTVVRAPELLDLQFDSGKRTYTCAMEGISQRLRVLLQKNLDQEVLLQGITELVRRNMRQLKVFLILTGYEDQADFSEFSAFLSELKKILHDAGCRAAITFSFACLFRPPHTPMQFAGPRMAYKEFESSLNHLTAMIKKQGFEARISAGPADAFVSEFMAYADRRTAPILIEASISKGFRYRGEISSAMFRFFEDSLEKLKLPLLADRQKSLDTVFPWDDIDTGIDRKFLFDNWQMLLNGKEKYSCIGKPWGSGVCAGCGACESADEIKRLNQSGPTLNPGFRLAASKKAFAVLVVFEIPQKWAWCGKNFVMAALARRLMLDNPEKISSFIRVAKVLPEFFASGFGIAEIEFSEPVSELKFSENDSDQDIKTLRLVRQKRLQENDLWPIEIDFSGQLSDSRRIDALLNKYRLKHHKQRNKDMLEWEINKGQAKKAGIQKISLHEPTGCFKVLLLKTPEVFLLNLLTERSAVRVNRIGKIVSLL